MKRSVSIVTGFLGSGKTTLLTNLLENEPRHKTAILVNEFGKVGLDHHLLRQIDEDTRLIRGGCLCCSVREDLVRELTDLLNRDQRGEMPGLERVVIETSGLADPAPILFTILSDPVLQHHYEIESVIVTVDAVNAGLHLAHHEETAKQIAVADRIVITKSDLAAEEDKKALVQELAQMNPAAQIAFAVYGKAEASLFSRQRDESAGMEARKQRLAAPQTHHRQESVQSLSLTFDRPIDWNAFGLWLSMLLHANGEKVLRVKGLLDVGEAGPVLLNGVQHVIHAPKHLPTWPRESEARSHLVFIMKDLESAALLSSLDAFQHLLGAKADLSEAVVIH